MGKPPWKTILRKKRVIETNVGRDESRQTEDGGDWKTDEREEENARRMEGDEGKARKGSEDAVGKRGDGFSISVGNEATKKREGRGDGWNGGEEENARR